MLPGAGSLISAIQTATQVEPTVIAKPEIPIMDGALNKLHINQQDVVMVGDNYNTDILAGINSQINTLLVYSGVSTPKPISQMVQMPTHEVETLDNWTI